MAGEEGARGTVRLFRRRSITRALRKTACRRTYGREGEHAAEKVNEREKGEQGEREKPGVTLEMAWNREVGLSTSVVRLRGQLYELCEVDEEEEDKGNSKGQDRREREREGRNAWARRRGWRGRGAWEWKTNLA